MRPLVVSAPGSLMVLGEHAVLNGFPCLVAAIDRRVRVSILPRNDGIVTLTSALGDYEGDRNDLPDHPSFRFVLATLRRRENALPGGLDAVIEADMPSTIGFGTSAAVTVAMLGALHMASGGSARPMAILHDAREVIRSVQGRGSGADAAASCLGGVVRYATGAASATTITRDTPPLTALYCGYKKPTPEVIAWVQARWQGREADQLALFERMGEAVEEGVHRLERGDHQGFGDVLDRGQTMMEELGVDTPELDACVTWLREQPGISGAKISGSGLGDCALGWGPAGVEATTYTRYDLHVAREGLLGE